jgi:hypothetical protein
VNRLPEIACGSRRRETRRSFARNVTIAAYYHFVSKHAILKNRLRKTAKHFLQGLKPIKPKHQMSELKLRHPKERTLPAAMKPSTVAPVLPIMIDQVRSSCPLPPIPFGSLLPAQGTQARQVLPASANFEELESESLMFDAA